MNINPVKTIIPSDPTLKKVFKKDGPYLKVSEFYYDTIQGEGVYAGYPSAILRLQGCTLNCQYCDTTAVWKHGNPYSFNELFDLMDDVSLYRKLKDGHHLIITGGSPLLQQESLNLFFTEFKERYGFFPFTEIENECTIYPRGDLLNYVDVWNNSPKLYNSGGEFTSRYKPEVIKFMSLLENSWFKFVINDKDDWKEIEKNYLNEGLIKKDQILLMPNAMNKEQLMKEQEKVASIAIKHNVRYSPRLHIAFWGKTPGV